MRISFTDLGMEGRLTGVRLELLAYLLPIIGRKDGSQTAGSLCGAYIMFSRAIDEKGRAIPGTVYSN